ncbi:MAG: DNA recombination protein RmuC [Verrucomicrobiales bacterium]|nr:DNA recombination protein RmuC [Verrucomicrobiales bacterium]
MNLPWLIALAVLGAVNLVLLLTLWRKAQRPAPPSLDDLRPFFETSIAESRRLEESLRAELGRHREESGRAAAGLREELAGQLREGFDSARQVQSDGQRAAEQRLDAVRDSLASRFTEFGDSNDQRVARLRSELNDALNASRAEARETLGSFQRAVGESIQKSSDAQRVQNTEFAERLERLTATLQQQFEAIRLNIEQRLDQLQQRNDAKLEEMRKTVDEKLESTLERRLGESFKLVSERLEQVHKGLGEMQSMASSVGDLKRVLTNVKTRGTWGEIQLGALLEQVLTSDQYAANVAPKPNSQERVEFALRLPGRDAVDAPVWLPIDAKFPQEDYQRLLEAVDRGDVEAISEAGRALETRLRHQAREIRTKYVEPPHTTDFAVLFLPSESLYSEALRRPGLAEALQQEHRVIIAGPTTLAALLNSLQMGFRTLAIQQRSSEVWRVLGAVKAEFGKFGDVLTRVKRKLEEASGHIEQTEVRSRAIQRKLKSVEELPGPEAAKLLPGLDSAEEGEDRPEASAV